MVCTVVYAGTVSVRIRKCRSSWKHTLGIIHPSNHQVFRKSSDLSHKKTKFVSRLKTVLFVKDFSKRAAVTSARKLYGLIVNKFQSYLNAPSALPAYKMKPNMTLAQIIKQVIPSSQNKVSSLQRDLSFTASLNNAIKDQYCLDQGHTNDEPIVYFSEPYNYFTYTSSNSAYNGDNASDIRLSGETSHAALETLNKTSSDTSSHADAGVIGVTGDSDRDNRAKTMSKHQRPPSQYDYLLETAVEQQQRGISDSSFYSSFKSLVEIPVNSFISLISRANYFEKVEAAGDTKNTDSVLPNDSAKEKHTDLKQQEKVAAPVSLLDTLIRYIPYGFTSPSEPGNGQNGTKKMDQAEQQRLRIQSQKETISRKVEINNRTRHLIKCIRTSNNFSLTCRHIEDFKNHLLLFPHTRITAVKENAIRDLVYIYRTTYNKDVLPTIRMSLALLGAVDPPKQKGIRVLCIDGGGVRGVVAVEVFRRIVELSGQPIHEMFDYICGVSTGAILAFLLGIKKIPIDDVAQIYRNLGKEIFSQTPLVGAGKLVTAHAYYSTETLEKILLAVFGEQVMIESAADEDTPKCSAVSCLVNRLVLKPFVWRNYSIVPGTPLTHWPGSCRGKMWEALRASSAAPGYFEEFKKGHNIHQDGGLLTNNPTGVAMNECRLLWPNSPIQCVVSVGTGRYEPSVGPTFEHFLSLKDKILKVLDSATSVSEVHTVMYDLLPNGTYFRFNPFIREPIQLSDYEESKLDVLVEDAQRYIERNDYKLRACVDTLLGRKRVFAR